MIRRWTITLIAMTAAVLLLSASRYAVRTVPDGQCSTLYHRYAREAGVETTFIKQMRLNDTVRVDLTLLQASDSAAWARLEADFDLPQPTAQMQALADSGADGIVLALQPSDGGPFAPDDTLQVVAASRALRCVSVFHVCTEAQFNAIVDKHIDEL